MDIAYDLDPYRKHLVNCNSNHAGSSLPAKFDYICRYPGDQVPPRTSSRSRQKVRHANHTPLRVVNLGVNRMAQASSGPPMCPAASAPAARPGKAPGPPRVMRPQLPLPGSG
jgi:hypothetical protein